MNKKVILGVLVAVGLIGYFMYKKKADVVVEEKTPTPTPTPTIANLGIDVNKPIGSDVNAKPITIDSIHLSKDLDIPKSDVVDYTKFNLDPNIMYGVSI